MKKKRIIIVRPYHNYGGPLVLSVMCKLLMEHGYDARLFYVNELPKKDTKYLFFWIRWSWFTIVSLIKRLLCRLFKGYSFLSSSRFRHFAYVPVKGCKVQYSPFYDRENTIVVYPEMVYGNFLRAKNVVRYLLFFNRFQGDPHSFGIDDLIICYDQSYNDWSLCPSCNEIQLHYFDKDTYRQYNYGEREGRCYIIRKGRNRIDLPQSFDGEIIDNEMLEEDIVRIFNDNKYCYAYDLYTYYSIIASVCGCISIKVMEPGKCKSDYIQDLNKSPYGIAFGDSPEEIEWAVNTRHLLLESLDYDKSNERAIMKFIDLLNKHFGY